MKKLLLIILFASPLFAQDPFDWFAKNPNDGSQIRLPYCIPSNSGTVTAGCYKTVAGGTNLNYMEAIMIGQNYRVRQAGTLKAVTVRCQTKTNADSIKISIWRKDGTTYDLVGTSENFLAQLTAGSTTTVTLSTPITGCLEGDFYSIKTYPNTVAQLQGVADATNPMYYITGASTATDYAWASQSNLAFGIPVTLYMDPPSIVFIGDSQISNSVSGLETTINSNFSTGVAYKTAFPLSFTYQNMGLGSQSTTQINARYSADAIDLLPKVIVQNGGVNDLAGNVALTTMISNVRNMVETAVGNGIAFYYISILPWSNGTLAQHLRRDSFNTLIEPIIESNGGHFIDVETLFGVPSDSGGATDWLNPLYTVDYVHLNELGNDLLAGAIRTPMILEGCIEPAVTPTIPFDTATMNLYWIADNATGTITQWQNLRDTTLFRQGTSANRPHKVTGVDFDSTDILTANIKTQSTSGAIEFIMKVRDTNTYAEQVIFGARWTTPTLTVIAGKITINSTSGAFKFGTGYYNGVGYTHKTYSVTGLLNKYIHVVISFEATGKQSVYINGVLQTSGGAGYGTTYNDAGVLTLGAGMQNVSIRQFAVYRDVMLQATATSHYDYFDAQGLIDH